jgi:hypothetical protein
VQASESDTPVRERHATYPSGRTRTAPVASIP